MKKQDRYEFLYPSVEQFPFDRVCREIVKELEARNWQIPGIEVEFDEYGSGDQKLRRVSTIKGHDFKLWFCRVQRTLPGGRWNDTAAVTEIVIPGKELHVYEDESGPTLYVYTGKDYGRDREKFMSGPKVNSKLRNDPKMYLVYKGGCDCGQSKGASFEAVSFLTAAITNDRRALARMYHHHSGRRPPVLVHNNDLGREYDPENGEPVVFDTAQVMDEFDKYLREVVLKAIMAHPVPKERIDIFAKEIISFPGSMSIYCFADHRQISRIEQGKANPEELELADRYAMSANGYRLMSLDVPDDGTVPKVAYEGFLWCGLGEVAPGKALAVLKIADQCRWSEQAHVIRVKPNRANDIYIADHAEYEKRRRELAAAIKGRDRFTDAEIWDFVRARARTIVPISEYKGGFKEPVVLVGRELAFDEVEIVS